MARELKGVIHGDRYYRIPEDAVARGIGSTW